MYSNFTPGVAFLGAMLMCVYLTYYQCHLRMSMRDMFGEDFLDTLEYDLVLFATIPYYIIFPVGTAEIIKQTMDEYELTGDFSGAIIPELGKLGFLLLLAIGGYVGKCLLCRHFKMKSEKNE